MCYSKIAFQGLDESFRHKKYSFLKADLAAYINIILPDADAMKNKYYLNIFTFIIILTGLLSCAVNHGPVYTKNGKTYGVVAGNFTDRWYDYYERGLSYSNGEYFKEALSDIETAIKTRPRDQRWVNTYGMHFIDYFPHREKGIIYYFMGEYLLSEEELKRSIDQTPSAKASYFLDKVRTERMLQDKKVITKPEMSLSYPSNTRDERIEISGLITDDCYVSEIQISGENVSIDSSDKQISFKKQLYLPEENHPLEIYARNLMGGYTKKSARILVDRSGPTIVIKEFLPGSRLTGYLIDQSPLKSFLINNRQSIHEVERGHFSILLDHDIPKVSITASDTLGNKTKLLIEKVQNKTGFISPLCNVLLASAQSASSDASPGIIFPKMDISIKGMETEMIVYKKTIRLQGEIKSIAQLKKINIWLNDKLIGDDINGNTLSGFGKIISFNKSVSVKKGQNRLVITASDELENVIKKEFKILRKTPDILKLENRFALKIYPLDERMGKYEKGFIKKWFSTTPVFNGYSRFMDKNSRDTFYRHIEKDMLKKERFQLIALDQKRLENKTVIDDAIARYSGNKKKKSSPDALLIGNTCVDRNGTEITARLIHLATFEEILSKDVFSSGKSTDDVKKMAGELSRKFHQSLPVVEGNVEKITRQKVHVSLNGGRIEEGWPVYIYSNKTKEKNTACLSKGCNSQIIGLYTMGCDETVFMGKSCINVERGDKVINK